MNEKILMLNEKKGSFMLKAAQKALTDGGFIVDEILPDIQVRMMQKVLDMYLI
ncbi:MAG: hypothetical protein PHW47_03685 [Lachnospira sp.]|nr:hypothetical protein [Lachnospira sp.]